MAGPLLMTRSIDSRRGSYILEASIILPLMVLCVLSLGYFIRILGIWEECFHCTLDETGKAQAMAWDRASSYSVKIRSQERLKDTIPAPSHAAIGRFVPDGCYGGKDHIGSYVLELRVPLNMPLGFSRELEFSTPIIYRGFVGREMAGDPLGVSGLEDGAPGDPAYVFPAYGRKYHDADCTYVKASVQACRLDTVLRKSHDTCSICHSEEAASGSLVFCFKTPGTAYHKSSCRTISRHVIVMDRGEAATKGFEACSKCGGGAGPEVPGQ